MKKTLFIGLALSLMSGTAFAQKINFYSCDTTLGQKAQLVMGKTMAEVIDKNKCDLVSDLNVESFKEGLESKTRIISEESLYVAYDNADYSGWVKCDAEDKACITKGETIDGDMRSFDWFTTTTFETTAAQKQQLVQRASEAGKDQNVSLYFLKSKANFKEIVSQDTMRYFNIEKSPILIK